MTYPSHRRAVGAVLVALALLTAACGDKKEEDSSGGGGGGDKAFKACEVTDVGGVDDKSFNQTAYKGVQDAEKELDVEGSVLESRGPDDYEPNIARSLKQDCDIIVTVGFLLSDATKAAAEANKDAKFAIVDFDYYEGEGAAAKDVTIPNVEELTFSTDEAAFLAGYLSAGMSKTGKVATYGGIQIPTVTIFMDGFKAGVDQYNTDESKDVALLGWDGKSGSFVGNFEDSDKGKSITQGFLQDGADVVMPVAGPVGQGTVAAVEEDGGDAKVVWVDTDGCVSVPDACKFFLTSVMKNMDVAVLNSIKKAKEGEFGGEKYTGTLKNEGVQIAPYNEFEGEVPAELDAKVKDYEEKIKSGDFEIPAAGS